MFSFIHKRANISYSIKVFCKYNGNFGNIYSNFVFEIFCYWAENLNFEITLRLNIIDKLVAYRDWDLAWQKNR